jgi:hypothetical protein
MTIVLFLFLFSFFFWPGHILDVAVVGTARLVGWTQNFSTDTGWKAPGLHPIVLYLRYEEHGCNHAHPRTVPTH